MPYEIQKNIPAPHEGTKFSRYPFKTMEIGDSFFVPDKDLTSMGSLYSATAQYKRRNNVTFKVKKFPLEQGFRVWRIE